MVNYQNGKIYMIMTENSNDIYIGSTVQTLKLRLHQHECKYRKGVYRSSQEILKQGNYKIVLIKDFACNSLIELETEETKFQKDFVCVNKKFARVTEEEKQQRKELREMIKEEKQQRKQQRKELREMIKEEKQQRKNEGRKMRTRTIEERRLRDKLYKRKYRQRRDEIIQQREKKEKERKKEFIEGMERVRQQREKEEKALIDKMKEERKEKKAIEERRLRDKLYKRKYRQRKKEESIKKQKRRIIFKIKK
jgi:hypothetical protein